MDVGKLISKLEPLVPERAERWRRALDLADSEMKDLIEKEIIRTAYKVLGDFRRRPLLSLPPKTAGRASINLGTVIYEKEKWPFAISQGELLRNMGIFGMSGSGKTNMAFHILRQLVDKRVPFLFWDWKRTVRHLIPFLGGRINIYTPGRQLSPFPFNPFIVPPGLEPRVYVNHVVDVMADAYTLGDGSKRILQKALAACYQGGNAAPSVAAVLGEVEQVPAKERVRGWKISTLRALESLEFAGLTTTDAASQEAFAKNLLDGRTVVELDALDQGSKKFLVPLMSLWLYYIQLAAPEREKLRLVVFIEEAHHVLHRHDQRAKEPPLDMMLRQCREIGIGVVVIDQHPHLLSSAALGNAYTTICLNQRDPSDINKAASLSSIDDAEKRLLSTLPVGHAVVKLQDRWRRPFLITVPFVAVRKGLVTDELLGKMLKGSLTAAGVRHAVKRASGPSESSGLAHHTPLDEAALVLVEDVIEHPDDSVRMRYKRLRLSGDKGNRLKGRLIQDGILEEQQVKVGRVYRALLRVTAHASATLGLKKTVGRGSIAHEYWKRFYAQRYRADEYEVTLETPRRGGRADVTAVNASDAIAIEIETGKSDAVGNVKEDLLAGFTKVIVVATDQRAFDRLEEQLAAAGLILPGRIELVLRDQSDQAA